MFLTIISWILLVTALVPLGFGVRSLTARGKPARQRAGEPQLLGFEKTTALVTSGIYAYIRHPLYSSLLLLAWGVFFKAPGWAGAALAIILGLSTWILFELFVPEGDIEPQLYGLAASALGMLVGGLLGPKPHHRPHMGGHHAAAGTYHTHR